MRLTRIAKFGFNPDSVFSDRKTVSVTESGLVL